MLFVKDGATTEEDDTRLVSGKDHLDRRIAHCLAVESSKSIIATKACDVHHPDSDCQLSIARVSANMSLRESNVSSSCRQASFVGRGWGQAMLRISQLCCYEVGSGTLMQ